jgi:hypothetical protein
MRMLLPNFKLCQHAHSKAVQTARLGATAPAPRPFQLQLQQEQLRNLCWRQTVAFGSFSSRQWKMSAQGVYISLARFEQRKTGSHQVIHTKVAVWLLKTLSVACTYY